MTIHAAHTVAPERPVVWYAAPMTEIEHAFRGVRNVCSGSLWTAAWSIVGPIEAVDRSKACGACLILTGATETELRAIAGDR